MKKDLISTENLSKSEILDLIKSAKEFKKLNKTAVKKVDLLKGVSVINAFFENSTRTRTSFELAAKRLGADIINFSPSSSSTQKGETLIDTIKNIESMQSDFFVIRHFSSGAAKFVAKNTKAHVINAGDGCNEHPTQALLDIFTMQEKFGEIKGLNVAIIGDIFHSRVARSNIYALKKLGANIRLFGPPMTLRWAEVFGCKICKNIKEALDKIDCIIMLRIQLERQNNEVGYPSEYPKYFGLNLDSLKFANKNVLILHPGPVNRGVEMDSEVMDKHSSVFEQVENGVAMRMAVLKMLYNSKAK